MARAPSPDLSPEVDFGAFLRPAGGARPGNLPASQYSGFPAAPVPHVAPSVQQRYGAQNQSRARQGAPRLGGLGLGGIQSSPSPFPAPPAKKKVPTPAPVPQPRAQPHPPKLEPSPIERPFLSPEMAKPTVREGAFALNRPVPDVASSTTPPLEEQEETSEREATSSEPSPFLGLSPSPPTTPSMDRLGALAGQLELKGDAVGSEDQGRVFQMMDEVLGMVEAELSTAERRVAEDSEEEEGGSSLEASDDAELSDTDEDEEADGKETEEEQVLNGDSRQQEGDARVASTFNSVAPLASPAMHERTPSLSSRPASPVASIASANSFHSAGADEDEDEDEYQEETMVVKEESAAQGPEEVSTKSIAPIIEPPSAAPVAAVTLAAEAARIVVVEEHPQRSIDEVMAADKQPAESEGAEMVRSASSEYSDSGSFSATPPSRQSTASRGSRSTSRNRSAPPPPPRPSRDRRPPSAKGTSPMLGAASLSDVEGEVAPAPPAQETASTISHSPRSSISIPSIPSQASDSFLFVAPPTESTARAAEVEPASPSVSSQAPLASPPAEPVAATYEGLGLRLPSSIRPKGRRVSSQSSPPASPSQHTVPLVAPTFTSSVSLTSPASQAPSMATVAPAPAVALASVVSPPPTVPQVPTPVAEEPEKELEANSADQTAPVNRAPSSSPTQALQVPSPVEVEKEDGDASGNDSGLADIGVAAVGAIATGGMAVGYMAWRGISAAAGWGWRSNGSPAEEQAKAAATPTIDETVSDSDEEFELPGGLKQAEQVAQEVLQQKDAEDHKVTENDEGESVVSTEWGDIAFPAPAGFLEAFKEAMAELGPEDVAANERMEIDASEAAHDIAMQLHRENASPTPERLTLKPSPSQPFPSRFSTNKRASMISLEPARRSRPQRETGQEEGSEDDELMELISPMFDSRIPERSPSLRYSAPPGLSPGGLTRTFSSSTQGSVSSRLPPPTSPNSALKASLKPEKSGGFFGFGSKRRSSNSSRTGPVVSSSASITSSNTRAMSIGSNSSDSNEQTKIKRRSSLFGGSSIKSSSPSPPSTISSSIESQITDTTYVSYSSGRSKRSSSNASSTTSPPPVDSRLRSPGRRSSIRLESRYGSPDAPARTKKEKKIYTVRFANAERGIGLRSVAEDEAERAGGDRHAQRWVGVGRGDRYGNLIIQTDAESDIMYAEQVGQIKKGWRFGGNKRDWTTVRID